MPMLAISGTSINASSLITNLAISYLTISRIFVRATFCLNWWYMVISPLSFMSNSLCAHVEIEHASCLFCKKSVWAFNMRQGPKPSIFTFLQLQAFLVYLKHFEKPSFYLFSQIYVLQLFYCLHLGTLRIFYGILYWYIHIDKT